MVSYWMNLRDIITLSGSSSVHSSPAQHWFPRSGHERTRCSQLEGTDPSATKNTHLQDGDDY